MLRTAIASLIGLPAGALLFALLLRLTVWIVRAGSDPPLAVEHDVIYLGVLLGAGFGAVAGALVGLAGTLARTVPLTPHPPSRTTQSTA
jgi:hypothetical protein